MPDNVKFKNIKYEWLGQSTMRITTGAGLVIYTDPVYLDENPQKAGLILVTHHHVDHCLPEYITSVRNDGTKIAAYHESYIKYCAQDIKGVRTVKVGQTVELAGVRITGTEAYTKKGFHMKGEGCGFLLEVEGQRIYFSGDTSRTDEMLSLHGIDVAILPICDNTWTITPEDTVAAVKALNPGLFIPVHFTPHDEPEPELTGELYFSKDPRFFTRKEDPSKLLKIFEGTGIEVAILRKLGHQPGGKK